VLTHFLSSQIRADGKFDASVYIPCINKLFKESERRFEDYESMKFTVSFIINPFQEGDISENAELTCSVFKEKVSELEIDITNWQREISMKTRVNDELLEFSVVCTVHCYKMGVIKGECMFRFYLLRQIWVLNDENAVTCWVCCCVTYKTGYSHNSELQAITALSLIYAFYNSMLRTTFLSLH
jgi:hypothetical protein